MPLDPTILEKLRCPKSGTKLLPAAPDLLGRLSEDAGFVSEDGQWFYRVEEGFPVLTADAAVGLDSATLDWEDSYTSGETPWDKGVPAPPLVEFFKGGGKISGSVFVPGCGRGHDARSLAKQGAEVTALDISPSAIKAAQELTGNENAPEIHFVVGDLFHLPEEFIATFDWVFEHTCLSGLPPNLRPDYFKAIASALRPGGKLFAIWFINPDMDPGESGPPFGIAKEEVKERTADEFTLDREWVPEKTFEGRESRELVQILTKI